MPCSALSAHHQPSLPHGSIVIARCNACRRFNCNLQCIHRALGAWVGPPCVPSGMKRATLTRLGPHGVCVLVRLSDHRSLVDALASV